MDDKEKRRRLNEDARERGLMQMRDNLMLARQEGLEEGFKKGKALALLDIFDDETIAEHVGLDISTVEGLRRNRIPK